MKRAAHKFAFTGTNCSGKTTMALELTARLKARYHVLAELVASQDRKVTWNDWHFPRDPAAHYGMIATLIRAEVEAELRGDADVVVTDRSIVDLYSIMLTDHPDHPLTKAARPLVDEYAKTYDRIYYLEPLPYQVDGKRPDDEFRMKTHRTLLDLEPDFPNLVAIRRHEVIDDVTAILGCKPIHPVLGHDLKWQTIATEVGLTLLVKAGQDTMADHDVWILTWDPAKVQEVRTKVEHYFGPQYTAATHFMGFPAGARSEILSVHPTALVFPPNQFEE